MTGRGDSARGDHRGRGGRGGLSDSGNETLERLNVHDDTVRDDPVDEEETGVDEEAERLR